MPDWKEFIVDKGADFVIAFAGLYLAIGVQGWWDDRKDHEAYIESLESFKHELAYDKAQTIDTTAISQSLTDLQILSIYYQTEAQMFAIFDDPAQAPDVVNAIAELNAGIDAALAATPGATLAAVFERTATVTPAKLTPHYEDQIWKVYLAGGVKIAQENAKNPDLTREIGALYKDLASVEQRTRELETYYNEEFLPRLAEIHAASTPLESYWYHDETGEALTDEALLQKLAENQAQIAIAADELDAKLTENYVALQVASTMLASKIDDLVAPESGLLAKVGTRIDTVTGLIDAELEAVAN